jgi:tetrahydromethanopterin S-methyltransferase subunit G
MFPLILLGFILSGALMKLTDNIEDKNYPLPKKTAHITGITYGTIIGLLMTHDQNAAHLFSGIILGCLITNKIDTKSHYLALAAILLITFTKGITLSLPLVLTITILATIDELTNKLTNTPTTLQKILNYRITLKIGIILLALIETVNWNTVAYLLTFDAAYIITNKITTT